MEGVAAVFAHVHLAVRVECVSFGMRLGRVSDGHDGDGLGREVVLTRLYLDMPSTPSSKGLNSVL